MHFSAGDLEMTDDLRAIPNQQPIGRLIQRVIRLRQELGRRRLIMNALQKRQDRGVITRIGRGQRQAKLSQILIERRERVVTSTQVGERIRTSAHDGGGHH